MTIDSSDLQPCPFWAEKLAAGHPDDLSPTERLALQTHIASCPACSAVRAEYEAFWNELRQLPAIEPHPGLPSRLLALWQAQGGHKGQAPTVAGDRQTGATLASQPSPAFPARRKRRFGVHVQTLAAVLIVAALLGTFLAVYAARHNSELAKQGIHAGSGWKIVNSPSPGKSLNQLNAAAVVSTNDVWAVGYASNTPLSQPYNIMTSSRALIEHWNGSKWDVVASPNPGKLFNELDGVAAISTNDVWAVGYSSDTNDGSKSQGLIEHWNGQQWSVVPGLPAKIGEGTHLQAIATISANDIWAVGSNIEHWNGQQWSLVPGPNSASNTSLDLSAIAAISANNIWAVGATVDMLPHPLIEHWNGSQWSIVKSQAIAGFSELTGVAAISANDIWAVGGQGSDTRQMLIEHWNGAQWNMVAGENNSNADNNTLSGVVAVSSTDVWAVGGSPEGGRLLGPTLTEHWNGKQWSLVHSPNFIQTGDNYLLAIARDLHSSTLWAVGYSSSGSGKDSTLIEMYA